MARPSIEYLNARRELGPRRAVLPRRDTASDNAKMRDMDCLDIAHETVLATFADFRSWFRSLPSVESIADGTSEECF